MRVGIRSSVVGTQKGGGIGADENRGPTTYSRDFKRGR